MQSCSRATSDTSCNLRPVQCSPKNTHNNLPSVRTLINFDSDYFWNKCNRSQHHDIDSSHKQLDPVAKSQMHPVDYKTKLVSAINQLEIDKDTLQDLRIAFDCNAKQENKDAATALLHLGTNMPRALQRTLGPNFQAWPTSPAENGIKSQYRGKYQQQKYSMNRLNGPFFRHNIPSYATRPENIETTHVVEKIIKQQVFCQISTKTIKVDNFVDIWIKCTHFDTKNYKFELIRLPSNIDHHNYPNAVLIQASRSVLISNGNGKTVETLYRGQQVVSLGNCIPFGRISLTRINYGTLRIRIPVK
jgi:hypothetical protein